MIALPNAGPAARAAIRSSDRTMRVRRRCFNGLRTFDNVTQESARKAGN
jgi:hypothetical protein